MAEPTMDALMREVETSIELLRDDARPVAVRTALRAVHEVLQALRTRLDRLTPVTGVDPALKAYAGDAIHTRLDAVGTTGGKATTETVTKTPEPE